MNICFLGRSCISKFTSALYNQIKADYEPELQGHFITTNEEENIFVRKYLPEGIIHDTSGFIREHWNEYTVADLIEIEKEYDCAPIWSYIYTDRFLIHRDYQYCINITVGLFKFFEDIFKNNNIDFYYSEAIATLQCYIAYLVGKKYGVRYIAQLIARGLDSTCHYFLMDEFQRNINFRDDYMDMEYSDEEYRRADDFLKDFESRDIPPKTIAIMARKPKFKLRYFASPIMRFLRSFKKKWRNPYSYMYYDAYKNTTNSLEAYINYQRAKKYYHSADYDEKFVYYPLHYQPEASTIVCAQKYEKQLFFIDSLAKSLPADSKLYVKEHYVALGSREVSFYKELKKYPNVVLIDPWESSRKLIEKSQAVATLTGTVGWEAMLLRRPVFVCGKIFFDNAPGVIKTDDIYLEYIPKLNAWKKPERDQLVKYLCGYFRSLSEGSVHLHNPATYEEDNIKKVAKALYEQMSALRK